MLEMLFKDDERMFTALERAFTVVERRFNVRKHKNHFGSETFVELMGIICRTDGKQ